MSGFDELSMLASEEEGPGFRPIMQGSPQYGPVWRNATWVFWPMLSQRMHILQILKQNLYWHDSEHRTWRLEDMDPEHRARLRTWMFKHAAKWKPWWLFWKSPERWLRDQPFMITLHHMVCHHFEWPENCYP